MIWSTQTPAVFSKALGEPNVSIALHTCGRARSEVGLRADLGLRDGGSRNRASGQSSRPIIGAPDLTGTDMAKPEIKRPEPGDLLIRHRASGYDVERVREDGLFEPVFGPTPAFATAVTIARETNPEARILRTRDDGGYDEVDQ